MTYRLSTWKLFENLWNTIMGYITLMYWHLGTIVPAAAIGGLLLAFGKGTPFHRMMGKIYMALMLLTAFITLFMSAEVGPTLLNHFGFIHLFSVLVIVTVPRAYIAAKNHNVQSHKYSMLGMYVGAVLLAGSFTLMPGRYLHGLLLG
jgi:uncharacterized membrane protein